ncbi:hypothetical protein M271_15320 [Streptomyces rapamycinicus NRRL 5491]|nr:hypothetical protein M271_15320 [Streptomyces rapamycinicus NRRL 5491]
MYSLGTPPLGLLVVCIITRSTWLAVHFGWADQMRAAEAEVMAVA